jgi:hypothetical protein
VVNGINVETWKTEIYHFNILEIEVGTNGYCGGKSAEGGRTYFKLKDLGSTDMTAKVVSDRHGETEEVTIELGGDAELSTFIEALEFAVKVLKDQSEEKTYK